MKAKWNIQKLIYTGMLAALAGVLMSLEFSIPFMPPFYKVDLSDVPSVMALFLLGPGAAAWVEIIKILIKLFTVGTNTFYIGELANLLGIALYVVPLWILYQKMGSSRKAAMGSLWASLVIRTAFACLCNALITLPLYAAALGISLDQAVGIAGAVNPAIHSLTSFLILATIPFNVLKLGVNYLIGYFLYERIHAIYPVARMV